MPSPRGHRFTIYDALENAGYFDSNPANSFARDATTGDNIYSGPVEFPKMLYAPDGVEVVVRAGEPVLNPITGQYQLHNERKELQHKLVQNKEEEAEAIAEGWHSHPALAIRARIEDYIAKTDGISEVEKARLLKAIPQVSSESRIRELEAQLERLMALQVSEEGRRQLDNPKSAAPRPIQPVL